MKKTAFFITTIVLFCLQFHSCDEKKTSNGLNGGLVNHSECKSSKSALVLNDVPDSVSCINFIYDEEEKTLYLTHLNAGFNCCPGSLYCQIKQSNDTVIIEEFEKSSMCDCNCLFDLDYELSGVEKQSYIIKFIEPYLSGQTPLIFELDLTGKPDGSYCVSRNQYPWGIIK
jgi:hypothetical protein